MLAESRSAGGSGGGDFYTFALRAPTRLAVVIGDACGRGADGAALVPLVLPNVDTLLLSESSPSRLLSEVNRRLVGCVPMDRFVTAMGRASLLCDLVDAETVGLENALRVIRAHPETDQVGVRVDSGDIAEQCALYFQRMKAAGIAPRLIVFEDEVTPELVRKVYDHFRQATGEEPTMLFPGAGADATQALVAFALFVTAVVFGVATISNDNLQAYGNNRLALPSIPVAEGVMKPLRVKDSLILARRVRVSDKEFVQGCWLDWPSLSRFLIERVTDLLPAASLELASESRDGREDRMLAALPVELVPGEVALAEGTPLSIRRKSLGVAWGCLILAAAAV